MARRKKATAPKARTKRGAGRRRERGRSKSRSISVDFTDVESRVTLPESDYHLKVEEVTEEEGDEYPYLKWKFRTIHSQKNLNNKPVYTNTSLSPQSLWNLRNLLEAGGVETPDSEYDINLDDLVDLEIIGSIEHEVYEDDDGKETTQMRIVDYMPVTDSFQDDVVDDDEGEDEEENDEEEDEDSDEEDEEENDEGINVEDVQDMNASDLSDLVEAYELDVDFKGMRSLRKKQNAVIESLTEAGYLEEDE